MDARSALAISAGKLVKFINKHTGTGGTAAPGLVSSYLDKNLLKKLSSQLEKIILITGTNGKTTTSRIVGNFLEYKGINYIHNRHGSNLERGLISCFVEQLDFFGKLKANFGVFEVDEAVLKRVVEKIFPNIVTINNLFRDQLDRYGEVDNIKKMWLEIVKNLENEVTLVLNADDPTVSFLGRQANCKVLYFGVDDLKQNLGKLPIAVDSSKCPVCLKDLFYNAYFLSHQGIFECKNCDFKRPKPDITAEKIELGKNETQFVLFDKSKDLKLHLAANLPGLYNIYNCLAAYTTIKAFDDNIDIFPVILKEFKPVFGRNERFFFDGRNIIVALAKNPTGFNEVIRTFLDQPNQFVLLLINDKIADGRDVSWIWDVDFEQLENQEYHFTVGGVRSTEMALRLKYAGIKNVTEIGSIKEAFFKALSSTPINGTLTIIPTYTAMLDLKRLFANKKITGKFWED